MFDVFTDLHTWIYQKDPKGKYPDSTGLKIARTSSLDIRDPSARHGCGEGRLEARCSRPESS